MHHIGNNTNFQRLLKLVFTSFSTKNIMDTIEEGMLNALVFSSPNLKKLEIRHFGNKPFIYGVIEGFTCTIYHLYLEYKSFTLKE